MILMNLSTKQKQTHRHRKQTYVVKGEKGRGRDELGVWGQQFCCCCYLVIKPWQTLCNPVNGPGDFPGKNTGVGCHFFLQGIFPTQESNLRLLQWQVDSLPLRHLGSPNSSRKVKIVLSTAPFNPRQEFS